MKKVSIVIPVSNREIQLIRCLNSLACQKKFDSTQVEIIISDMSMKCNKKKILDSFKIQNLNIKIEYIYTPTNKFNISRCRNIGASKATGEYLTFIDVDIILPNNFIENLLNRLNQEYEKEYCLIHYIYGFNVSIGDEEASMLLNLNNDFSKELFGNIEYLDIRDSIFEEGGDRKELWVFSWSGLITYKKEQFIHLKGFDEHLAEWGSEDTDLGYRMYLDQIQFIPTKEIYGVHIPHEQNFEKKSHTNLLNRESMHRKYWDLRTETYLITTGLFFETMWKVIKNLTFIGLNPQYTSKKIDEINSILADDKKNLVIGIDDPAIVKKISANYYFSINKTTKKNILLGNKDAIIFETLGICTHFDNNYFDNAIIFDSIFLLKEEIQNSILTEINRISKKVLIVKSPKFSGFFLNKGMKEKKTYIYDERKSVNLE